jgi:hypothetical protein
VVLVDVVEHGIELVPVRSGGRVGGREGYRLGGIVLDLVDGVGVADRVLEVLAVYEVVRVVLLPGLDIVDGKGFGVPGVRVELIEERAVGWRFLRLTLWLCACVSISRMTSRRMVKAYMPSSGPSSF